MSEKLMHDADAEASVLGCLLIDDKEIKEVLQIVSNEDFFERRNQLVFRGIEWLYKKRSGIDLITLTDALRSNGVLDEVGGSAYLSELTNHVPTAFNVQNYANIVAEFAGKRKISSAAQAIAESSSSGSSLEETLSKVKEQIAGVNQLGGKQNKYQVASMLEYVEGSKERYKNWGKMQGLTTGFPSIDQLTLGLAGGELIIVAGPTSRGKTLLSMNIANNLAQRGYKTLFVTLEMTHEELTSRYMFANDGWETTGFKTVAENTIFQVNDELDWKDIDGLIENAKERLGVDLVVIDHLHYFTRELANVAEDLGRITKEFKKNAIRYDIPVILISHIRKLAKDEELSGDSLRGSSLIAQDADIVLLVNRDPETNEMGILMDKNRNRGKLSDRTSSWAGRTERELNTIYLEFNNTKLKDPLGEVPHAVQQVFPGATPLAYKE